MAQPLWADIASNPYNGDLHFMKVSVDGLKPFYRPRPFKFVNNKGLNRNQFLFVDMILDDAAAVGVI
jgi:hypothetical protein